MPPLVFVLVACAALLHATWNIILKTGGDPLRTSGRLSAASIVIGVPIAAVAWIAIGQPSVPFEAVALAVVSGILEFAYFVFLSAAYRTGELSAVYPIARGTAPLLAVAAGVVVLGERLGIAGALGVAALATGVIVLQRPWTALRSRAARGSAGVFALATGVVIAAYSAVDRVGARLTEPWLYGAMLFTVSTVLLVAWIRFVDAHRQATEPRVPAPWPVATAAGLAATAAYILVLVAYTLAPLSVVAPLRESAVVLVSGWASLRLREAVGRTDAARRIGGAGLVLVGALLLALE